MTTGKNGKWADTIDGNVETCITAWALRDFTASILPRPIYEVYTVSHSSQRSSGSSGISLAAVKVIAIRDRSRITRVARYTSCVNARKFVSPRFLRVCRSRSEQTKLAREARPSSRPRSIPRNETKQNKTKKVKEKEKPFLPLYRALSAISFFPFLASRRDAKFDPRDDSTTTRNR